MNKEVKEILEDYKRLVGKITEKLDNTAEYENWLIIQEYFDKLLDYIINLEEEKDIINTNYDILYNSMREMAKDMGLSEDCIDEDMFDWINNIKQENEKLKEELENKFTSDEIVSMLNKELKRQSEDYKSRIDKAKEYVKEEIYYCLSSGDNIFIYLDKLLEILGGDSNE